RGRGYCQRSERQHVVLARRRIRHAEESVRRQPRPNGGKEAGRTTVGLEVEVDRVEPTHQGWKGLGKRPIGSDRSREGVAISIIRTRKRRAWALDTHKGGIAG